MAPSEPFAGVKVSDKDASRALMNPVTDDSWKSHPWHFQSPSRGQGER